VKEAFQKLEEFTNSVEQRSKAMSPELHQCRHENPASDVEEVTLLGTKLLDLHVPLLSSSFFSCCP